MQCFGFDLYYMLTQRMSFVNYIYANTHILRDKEFYQHVFRRAPHKQIMLVMSDILIEECVPITCALKTNTRRLVRHDM